MTRTTRNSGKATMRAVGMLVCALSIVTTLAGVARSGDSNRCQPSPACFNATNITLVPVGVPNNVTFVGTVCLKAGDKTGLKLASRRCEDMGRACCQDGDLEACPTSKPGDRNGIFTNTTNICQFSRCPVGQRLWFCKLEREDD